MSKVAAVHEAVLLEKRSLKKGEMQRGPFWSTTTQSTVDFVVDVRAYIERCLRFPRGATPQPPRHFAKSTAKFPNRRPGNPRPNPHPPLSLSLQINRDAGGRIVDQILALPKLWPLPFKRVSALDSVLPFQQ